MKVESIGQIFTCEKCGNEVIITKIGGGELKCCNKPMKIIENDEFEITNEENEEAEE